MKKRDKQSRAEAAAEPVEVVIDPATYQPTGCIEQDLPMLCRKHGLPEMTCGPFQTAPGPPPPPASTAVLSPATTTAPPPSTGRGGKSTASATSPSAPSTGRGGKSTARDKQAAAEAAAAAAAAALEAQVAEEPPDPNAPMTYREVSLEKMAQRTCQVRYANDEDKTSLEELRVSKWTLRMPYIVVLAEMMPLWKQLTDLQLVNTDLSTRQIAVFVYALQSTTTSPPLRSLTLDGNEVDDIAILIMLLRGPFKLHKLSLRACKIDDEMCAELEPLLLGNASLRILDLSLNRIYDNGAAAIAGAIRFNRTLLMVSLIGNNITDVGAGIIAEALQMFQLTHAEIVTRRRLVEYHRKLNEPPPPQPVGKAKGSLEHRSKSPTGSGRDSMKIMSGKAGRKSDAGSKVSSKKKDDDKGRKAESRLQKTRNKSSMSEGSPSNKDPARHAEEAGAYAAMVNDVEAQDGKLWCFGNLTLASLDLTQNDKMTEETAKRFIEVITYQAHVCQERKPPRQGLLRCEVNPKYCPPPPVPLADPEPKSEPQRGLSLSLVTMPLEVPWLTIKEFLEHADPVVRKEQLREEREREAARMAAADAEVAA